MSYDYLMDTITTTCKDKQEFPFTFTNGAVLRTAPCNIEVGKAGTPREGFVALYAGSGNWDVYVLVDEFIIGDYVRTDYVG